MLEGDPAVVAGGRLGDVAPQRGEPLVEGGRRRPARRRSPRRRRRPSPRAGRRGGPPCRRSGRRSRPTCGRRLRRWRRSSCASMPRVGEQVSGRVEEALARLRSPLPLRGHPQKHSASYVSGPARSAARWAAGTPPCHRARAGRATSTAGPRSATRRRGVGSGLGRGRRPRSRPRHRRAGARRCTCGRWPRPRGARRWRSGS